MNATAALQTHTLNDGPRVTTTYMRADLGINTALVVNAPDGRWVARLYYGPEPDEHFSETVDRESTADRLAIEHSLAF
jgi:hypothetical protein